MSKNTIGQYRVAAYWTAAILFSCSALLGWLLASLCRALVETLA